MKVTSIETLNKFAEGEVIQLPSFVNGEEFCVRLRRPSFLGMVQSGKFPNALLNTANDLFSKTEKKTSEEQTSLKEIADIMLIVLKEAMIEPTFQQLEDLGLQLTDEQQMAIFQYTQTGLKKLATFHENAEIL